LLIDRAVQLTIFARDAVTGQLINGDKVLVHNYSASGRTEVPETRDANIAFTTTFHRQMIFDPELRKWVPGDYPSCTVTAVGYTDAFEDLFGGN
jgi:hypothetical protein